MSYRNLSRPSSTTWYKFSYVSSSPIDESQKVLYKQITAAIAGETCPICLDDNIGNEKAAVIVDCMHVYCIECIEKWSKRKQTCPLCKSPFDSWFYRYGRGFRKHELRPLIQLPPNPINQWQPPSPEQLQWIQFIRSVGEQSPPRYFEDASDADIRIQFGRSTYQQTLQGVPYRTRDTVEDRVPASTADSDSDSDSDSRNARIVDD